MVDNSRQVDFSGDTLLVSDIIYGVGVGAGMSGSSGLSQVSMQDALRFTAKAVNFNLTATDAATIPISLPTGASNYTVERIDITNANHTLVTATVGVFSGAGGTGTTIAADQAITVTNGTANTALNHQALTLSPAATICFNFANLIVRIGTSEGAAATADVTITIRLMA